MSTRCKACDGEVETILLDEFLCNDCKIASQSEWNYNADHRFVLENADDGATPPLPTQD